MAADPPAGPLHLFLSSPDEAREMVVRYGDRRDVTVHVPNLERLGDAARVIEELLPQLKRRIWVLEPAYMLKRVSSLDTALWYLWEKGVDKVLVCLATAIGFYDLLLTPPGTTKLYDDDVPLPDMDVAGGNPPAAVLLQEVQALGDDQADSAAAAVALLRGLLGLLGAGNGTVLIAELRQALTAMDAVFQWRRTDEN